MPACHGLEVFGVFVVGQAEVEPRRAFGHVAGAQAVQQAVEERRSGRAFGRCNPHLWLHAGEAQTGVHGRPQAVQDHIAGLFGKAKSLVQSELVHLHAVARHLRDGQRTYEAAVGEPLFHATVAQTRLQGQRAKPARVQLLHIVLEMLFGVLARLRQIVNLPIFAQLGIARVLGVYQRGLAALARRGKHDGVVPIRSRRFVDLAGHVGHVALPRQQRFAQ